MNYKTIKQDGTAQEDIRKSKFICQMKRVTSEEEARDFIAKIKKKHHKANHSCSAMIIGEAGQIKRSSDDGEPSGTAGVPMLTVLEKQELTNLVAVVTRYFGGIKLGAGGLIRAYAGSVAHALTQIGTVEVKTLLGLKITLSYTQYQQFNNFLQSENLQEFDTEFSVDVTSYIYLNKEDISDVSSRLVEFYQGKIQIAQADEKIVEIPIA